MIIVETITRECCQPQDFKQYKGAREVESKYTGLKFCAHCGQLWFNSFQTDGTGTTELARKRLNC